MSSSDGDIQHQRWDGRAILLVDLDAFFASVEQLDHPEWRGCPVIVGGDADKRGVVSTCSYEARAYGVRSAMPSATAAKLCPDAIWTHGHFDRYREVSRAVMDIICAETPKMDQVSIDEAFADITPTRINREHPISVAERIQKKVSGLGITCSIGLAATKSVAKIASDMDKPNGLTVVYPGQERSFLSDLPVGRISGIGKSAQAKLAQIGVHSIGELAVLSVEDIRHIFGVAAHEMLSRARGCDTSEVAPQEGVKSVSHELSFARDLETLDEISPQLIGLLSKVCRRMRMKNLFANTLSLKLRDSSRTLHNVQLHLSNPSNDEIEMRPYLMQLLTRVWTPGIKVRLLGVGCSGLAESGAMQDIPVEMTLFDTEDLAVSEKEDRLDRLSLNDAPQIRTHGKPIVKDADKRHSLLSAFDTMKDRFGEDAIRFGSELGIHGNTTGSSSKNPADYK